MNRPFKRKATAQLIALLAVTAASTTASAQQSMPVVVNPQTGAQVTLTRGYWNANVDIAYRSIKCDYFRFNVDSAVYEFYLAHEYMHAPFLSTSVGNYVITDDSSPGFSSWTVQDGIYRGLAAFDSHEYVELVNYETGSGVTIQDANNNAIRIWHIATNFSLPAYSVCFDKSGMSFMPTGSADIGNTNLVDLDELEDFSFQFPQPLDANHEVPVIYRDGERVTFVRGEWNYNKQLATNTVLCTENLPPYNGIGSRETPIVLMQEYLAYFGGDSIYLHETHSDFDAIDRYTYSRSTSNINLGGLGFSDGFMELTETGFNIHVTTSRYFSCTAPTPKRVLALMPDSCDYGTADQFDGWGWNPITQQGCPPLGITPDTMVEENLEEQVTADTSVSDEQSSNVDNDGSGNGSADAIGENGVNEQVISDASVSGDQSNEGDDSLLINSTIDDSSDAAGNDLSLIHI